jgi:hypothetical protein
MKNSWILHIIISFVINISWMLYVAVTFIEIVWFPGKYIYKIAFKYMGILDSMLLDGIYGHWLL